MKILGLDHLQLAIPPGGEELARNFYGSALGLEEIPKPPVLAARGGLWFACGSQQLHLGIEQDFRPARKAHPGLLVDDLDSVIRTLSEAGHAVRPGEALQGMRRCFVDDPFGNRLEFVERQETTA